MGKIPALVKFSDDTILVGCYWTINCEVNHGFIPLDTLIHEYNGSLSQWDYGNIAHESGKSAEEIVNKLKHDIALHKPHVGEIVEVYADDEKWYAIANKEHMVLLYNRYPYNLNIDLGKPTDSNWEKEFMEKHPSTVTMHNLW